MSIAPPSDIILDVAQAADPQRLQAATSKLAKLASGSATVPDDFETLLTQAGGLPPSTTATPVLRNSTLAPTPATVVTPPASPYRQFAADGLRRPGFCRRRRGTGPEDRIAVSSPDPARRCTLSGG